MVRFTCLVHLTVSRILCKNTSCKTVQTESFSYRYIQHFTSIILHYIYSHLHSCYIIPLSLHLRQISYRKSFSRLFKDTVFSYKLMPFTFYVNLFVLQVQKHGEIIIQCRLVFRRISTIASSSAEAPISYEIKVTYKNEKEKRQ